MDALHHGADPITTLGRLGVIGGAECMPRLLTWLSDPDLRVRNAAEMAVSGIFRRLSASDWVEMSRAAREMSYLRGATPTKWIAVVPDSAAFAILRGDIPTALEGFFTFNGSGYVREAAVRALALREDGLEVPFLLLRAADWVPQVRIRAERALIERLVPARAAHVARWLHVHRLLTQRGLYRDRDLDTRISSFLRTEPGLEAVLANVDSIVPDLRRESCHFAAEVPAHSRAVLERALDSDDLQLRTWAVRMLTARFSREEIRPTLTRSCTDRIGEVRLAALRAAWSGDPWPELPSVEEGLFDRLESIRLLARYVAGQRGLLETAPIYRDMVRRGVDPRLPFALAGLAQVGAEEDRALIEPLLGHSSPRVRAAALDAIRRLCGENARELLLTSVASEPRTSKIAVRALLRRASRWRTTLRFTRSEIDPRLVEDERPHVRLAAVELGERLAPRDALAVFEKLCGDGDERVSALAIAHLARWLPRHGYELAQEDLPRLERAVSAVQSAGGELPARFVREFEVLRRRARGE